MISAFYIVLAVALGVAFGVWVSGRRQGAPSQSGEPKFSSDESDTLVALLASAFDAMQEAAAMVDADGKIFCSSFAKHKRRVGAFPARGSQPEWDN